jgi:hypothetical protein
MRPNNGAGPTAGLHNLQDFARKARCKSVQLMPTPTPPAPTLTPTSNTHTVTFFIMGARQTLSCFGQVVWLHDTRDFETVLICENYVNCTFLCLFGLTRMYLRCGKSLCCVKHHVIEAYGKAEVYIHVYLTLSLHAGGQLTLTPATLPLCEGRPVPTDQGAGWATQFVCHI